MDKITVSTFQLFQMFPDAESARAYFEARRWPDGVRCPVCGSRENITARKRAGFYRCNNCHEDFTVATGTVLERSHVPLHIWIAALAAGTEIPGRELAERIGVSYPTAWLMRARLREALGG